MRVTLAYPIAGLGGPDETVTVDKQTGRTLIADGRARPAVDEARSSRSRPAAEPQKEADDGR